MTRLFRVRTSLTGFIGAPGVATMYFLDIATAASSVQSLWTSIATVMPPDVRINVEGFGDVIEDTTGDLVESWTGVAQPQISGSFGGPYAAPVGILLRWSTDTIADHHRVRGRTFVVPCTSTMFLANGQVDTAAVADVQTAMTGFVTAQSSSFVIWHRPFDGSPATPTHPARPAFLGSHALVTGSGISTKAVVLRSRRD